MMPVMDGIQLVMKLREHYDFPVIILSAKSEDIDKITGLNIGADDYVTKPFGTGELLARVRAALRSSRHGAAAGALPGGKFTARGLVIDYDRRLVFINGQEIKLTQTEYSIMKLFMENPGKALSREDILESVWGADYKGELKIVDVNIRRLRIKIEDTPTAPEFITTIWGYGYKWGS